MAIGAKVDAYRDESLFSKHIKIWKILFFLQKNLEKTKLQLILSAL